MFRISLCFSTVLFCSLRVSYSQIQGDPQLLQVIATKFRDNMDRIETWSGEAEVSDRTTHDGVVTHSKTAIVKFVYSNDGDRLRFNMNFTKKRGEDPEEHFQFSAIHRDEGVYRFGPFEEGVERRRTVLGPLPQNVLPKGFRSESFAPFIFSKVVTSDKSVERFCNFYFDNRDHPANRKSSIQLIDGNGIAVMTSNTASDLVKPFWEYHFDLEKAGFPVYVQGGLRTGTDVVSTWENEYVEVDGIWLPSKHKFQQDNQAEKMVRSRVIEYKAHKMNAPVDEGAFEAASLSFR